MAASAYDALLEPPATTSASPYDSLLAHPAEDKPSPYDSLISAASDEQQIPGTQEPVSDETRQEVDQFLSKNTTISRADFSAGELFQPAFQILPNPEVTPDANAPKDTVAEVLARKGGFEKNAVETAMAIKSTMVDLVNSFSSPGVLATLGLGAMSNVAKNLVAAAFAAHAIKTAPDLVKAYHDAPNGLEKKKVIGQMVVNAGIVGTAGHIALDRVAPLTSAALDATKPSHEHSTAVSDHTGSHQTGDAQRQAGDGGSEQVQGGGGLPAAERNPAELLQATLGDQQRAGRAQPLPEPAQLAPETTAAAEEILPKGTGKITQLLDRRQKITDPIQRQRLWDEAQALLKGEEAPMAQAETEAPSPHDYLPAIKVEGEVVKGNPGETHKDILDRFVAENPEKEAEAIVGFDAPDNPNFFLKGEQPVSREALKETLGVKDSQGLRDLQAKEPKVTSTKNIVGETERIARGKEPLQAGEHVSDATTWEQAGERLKQTPTAGADLVTELNEKPRPITSVENDILLRHKIATHAEGRRLIEEANKPDLSDSERTSLQSQLELNDQAVDAIDAALKSGGTETGRALAARRKMADEDYQLVPMRAKLRAVKGEKLTPAEETKVEQIAGKIEETQKAVEKTEETAKDALAKDTFAQLLKTLRNEAKESAKSGNKVTEFLRDQAEKARARIRARGTRLNAGLNPAELADHVIIGAEHIANGIVKLAEFTTKMVGEFGQVIRPFVPDIFEKSKTYAEASAKLHEGRPEPTVASITKDAPPKLDSKMVVDLARLHVKAGMSELDAVVKAVQNDLKGIYDGLTERQVRDAFSDYGKVKLPNQAADAKTLRDLRAQGQLASALEDATAGEAPKKSGSQRDKPSQKVRELRRKVVAKMKEMGIATGDQATKLSTAQQARKTSLENQIADLSKAIATKERIVRSKGGTPLDAEAKAMTERRDTLKKQYDEQFPKEPLTDAQLLDRYKADIAKRTAELERRVAERDFSTRTKRTLELDKEAQEARFQNEKAQAAYHKELLDFRRANRTGTQKAFGFVGDTLDTARAIKTAADLSAVLRQGGFIAYAHPIRAARSFPAMLRAFRSERGSFAVAEEIASRPNAPLYKSSKLYLADEGTHSLNKQEEAFRSRWANQIPLVAGSQRAYTAFLNRLRADSFDAMVATLGRRGVVTPMEANAIANFVNVATGRGDVGKAAAAANALNNIFFAPRFVTSRFQLLAGQPLYRGTARTRTLVAQEYAKMLGGAAMVYGLLSMMKGKDDKGIELDPRSTEFGKVQVGDTHIDPMFGLIQPTVFTSRMVTGETKKASGEIQSLRGGDVPFGGDDSADVLARFLRTKLSPTAGSAVNVAAGRDVAGNPTNLGREALLLPAPISLMDIYQIMQAQGYEKGTIISLLNLFGMSASTYQDRTK